MVVVAAVLVVGDDEQGLLPGRAVAAQGLVDVVEQLLADGQVRDRVLVIFYLEVVLVVGVYRVGRARPGYVAHSGSMYEKAASWPVAASSWNLVKPETTSPFGPGWTVSGKSPAVRGIPEYP